MDGEFISEVICAHFLNSIWPPDAILISGSSHARTCGQNHIEGYVMHFSCIMWPCRINFCSYFYTFNISGNRYGRRIADSILVIIIFWTRHIEWCEAGLSCWVGDSFAWQLPRDCTFSSSNIAQQFFVNILRYICITRNSRSGNCVDENTLICMFM